MNRRTLYTIVIVVILFFLFFNPFKQCSNENVPLPYVPQDTLEKLETYVVERAQSPEDYIIDTFDVRDIVFVGEFGQIKQQVGLIESIIPAMYENGIRHLGVEIALREDQKLIDDVLTANEYDREAVKQILFNRLVVWGFEEYASIFEAAWRVNRDREEGAEPFRIIGLNNSPNWHLLEDQKEMNNPEKIAQVFEPGIPDAFIAETIMEELVRKDYKALIYTSTEHALTRFELKKYTENAHDLKLSETRRTGNIVYDRIGDDAFTILLHSPWPYQKSQSLITYPAEGAIDRLLKKLPEDLERIGFDVVGTPFEELSAERNDYAAAYDDLTLGDICDGYIVLGPLEEYEVVTPIPEFIDESNIDEAVRNFPGPNIDSSSVEDMNAYIRNVAESRRKMLDRL